MDVNARLYAEDPFSSQPELDRRAATETPLHVAVRCGSYYSVALLCKQGADPSLQDSEGMTPLYCLEERENAQGETDYSRLMFREFTRMFEP